jgi:predicted nucleotidyltransferase
MDIEKRHLNIVKKILKQANSASFYAFGSRASKKAKQFSDLDICYRGEISRDLLLKMKGDFYESNLPYKVDLVAYNKLPKGFLHGVDQSMQEIKLKAA